MKKIRFVFFTSLSLLLTDCPKRESCTEKNTSVLSKVCVAGYREIVFLSRSHIHPKYICYLCQR